MKKALFVILIFCSFSLWAQEEKYQVACVAFYNLENLFDTIDQPDVRDEEFTPAGEKKYTSKVYHEKLANLSDVIAQLGTEVTPEGPVILGVAEIENRTVLEDLINQPKLKSKNYGIVHYDSPDKRGVDVALLYQKRHFQVLHSKKYKLTLPLDPTHPTRDQLVVNGLLDGDTITFIVNHWPSRRGGEKRSRPNRNAAAELSRHIIDSLLSRNANAKVILMGDLNDDPTSPSMIKYLKAKGNPKKLKPGELYNPMYEFYQKGIGTLAWRDAWNLFDQMVLTPALLNENNGGYYFKAAKVFNKPFLTQKEGRFQGYPWRTYVGPNYMGGYSDHFPVYLFLIKKI